MHVDFFFFFFGMIYSNDFFGRQEKNNKCTGIILGYNGENCKQLVRKVKRYPDAYADSGYSDQAAQLRSLIWVSAVRLYYFIAT